jgi:hypothetical protein
MYHFRRFKKSRSSIPAPCLKFLAPALRSLKPRRRMQEIFHHERSLYIILFVQEIMGSVEKLHTLGPFAGSRFEFVLPMRPSHGALPIAMHRIDYYSRLQPKPFEFLNVTNGLQVYETSWIMFWMSLVDRHCQNVEFASVQDFRDHFSVEAQVRRCIERRSHIDLLGAVLDPKSSTKRSPGK